MSGRVVDAVALAIILVALIHTVIYVAVKVRVRLKKSSEDRWSQMQAMGRLAAELKATREQLEVLIAQVERPAKAIADLPVLMTGLVNFGGSLTEEVAKFRALLQREDAPAEVKRSGPLPLDVLAGLTDEEINKKFEIMRIAQEQKITYAEAESLWKAEGDPITASMTE